MNKNSERLIWVIVFVIFLCAGNPAAGNERVRIGCSTLRISLPIFVAQEKGIFKKNGIDVDLVKFDTAQPLIDALCSGKLDVAGYAAFPIILSAQLRSKKELYYATLMLEDNKHPVSMFVVKKDSSIKKISDLKGKRIGILPTFAYKVWLELILQKNNVKLDEVIIQQVAPAMTPASLESGIVDAMFTNDPAVTACIEKGIGRLLLKEALVPKYLGSPFPFASFCMAKDFVNKNPVVAQRIINSLDEAIEYITANQQESKVSMGKFLPEAQRSFVNKYPDSLFLKSSQFTPAKLIRIGDSHKKLGIIKEKVDLSNALFRGAN